MTKLAGLFCLQKGLQSTFRASALKPAMGLLEYKQNLAAVKTRFRPRKFAGAKFMLEIILEKAFLPAKASKTGAVRARGRGLRVIFFLLELIPTSSALL